MPETDGSYDLAPPPPAPAAAPARQPMGKTRPIQTDRPCPKCGYNLRGLNEGHRCPECGSAIKSLILSNFNDELQYGNPHYAGRLALGMSLLLIGALVFPIQIVLILVSPDNWPYACGIGAFGSSLEFLGFWYFTAPETPPVENESRWSLRRTLRSISLMTFPIDLAMRASFVVAIIGNFQLAAVIGLALVIALGLFLVVRACTAGFYLNYLALRVPDDAMAQRAITVSWALVATSLPFLVGLAIVTSASSGMARAATLFCGSVPMGPFSLCYLWGLWLLFTFRRDFRASAQEARRAMQHVPGDGN